MFTLPMLASQLAGIAGKKVMQRNSQYEQEEERSEKQQKPHQQPRLDDNLEPVARVVPEVNVDAESKPVPQQAPHVTVPHTPLEQIESVRKEVCELMPQIENFTGTTEDREYRYLDEMMVRLIISLDNIDVQNNSQVRAKRKELINVIQNCITDLETIAKLNAQPDDDYDGDDEEDEFEVSTVNPGVESARRTPRPRTAVSQSVPSHYLSRSSHRAMNQSSDSDVGKHSKTQ